MLVESSAVVAGTWKSSVLTSMFLDSRVACIVWTHRYLQRWSGSDGFCLALLSRLFTAQRDCSPLNSASVQMVHLAVLACVADSQLHLNRRCVRLLVNRSRDNVPT